jgi:probable HAF family extracellular repeat protein
VSRNDADRREAFRTAPGAPINPATDGLGTLGGNSIARAINTHGQVVGDSDMLGSLYTTHAFRTARDARINPLTDDLGTLGGARSFAKDINDFGVVVGASTAVADPEPPEFVAPLHAFVYFDGEGMFDLNELVVNGLPQGWTLAEAEGINNKGQIVGIAQIETRPNRIVTRAFLLTPVPEPSLVAAPLVALALVGRRAGRRPPTPPPGRAACCPAAGASATSAAAAWTPRARS